MTGYPSNAGGLADRLLRLLLTLFKAPGTWVCKRLQQPDLFLMSGAAIADVGPVQFSSLAMKKRGYDENSVWGLPEPLIDLPIMPPASRRLSMPFQPGFGWGFVLCECSCIGADVILCIFVLRYSLKNPLVTRKPTPKTCRYPRRSKWPFQSS